jgi:hypothetical protein
MSQPKKRKIDISFVEYKNDAFSDYLKGLKVEYPDCPGAWEKEFDSDNNWTYRIRCVGPCRKKNLPFSVKESGCENSIKTGNGTKN